MYKLIGPNGGGRLPAETAVRSELSNNNNKNTNNNNNNNLLNHNTR